MRYLGMIIVLLGALALVVPFYAGFQTNASLVVGGVLLVAGTVVHAIVQKRNMDKGSPAESEK